MNLLYHSIYGFFAIYFIFINVHKVVNSNDIQSRNLLRSKRVYNGSGVNDGQFPFVVFIRSLDSNKTENSTDQIDCKEQVCTGTLIHARFALTLLSCVINPEKKTKIHPQNVKIFLKTRPYAEIKENMMYKIGQEIISKPTEPEIRLYSENVALILMNDTFPEVNTYPRVMAVEPVAEGEILSCSTVGYSLIGRDLPRPVAEQIRPWTYDLEVMFNITECSSRIIKAENEPAYMCYAGLTPIEHSLCQLGDEGSPLLCKRPTGSRGAGAPQPLSSGRAGRQDEPPPPAPTPPHGADNAPTDAPYDGPYVYGLANEVPRCLASQIAKANWTKSHQVLFLYMLRYGPWINRELADFDEAAAARTTDADVSAATAGTTDAADTTAAALSTTTQLPAYYDTGDYDRVRKNLVRCNGDNGRPDVRGPSFAFFYPDARGGHWPARSRGVVAPAVPRARIVVTFLCATAIAAAV